jgi:hypothetical protein
MEPLDKKRWWGYIEADLQELLKESFLLVDIFTGLGADLPGGVNKFHDYSFIVFPAAKAYEGFLKKLFFDLGFITENDYSGKRFRIGKALNPDLPKEIRNDDWVYEKIVTYCGGSELADKLWDTWRISRNLVFHWFPNEKNALTLPEAQSRLSQIIDAIDSAFKECKIS